MKITFLGTSHGVPSAMRACTAYLIESGGAFYFIDAGAPLVSAALARELDMKSFKGVFTTHVHGDHTSSLINLADLANWYFKEISADFFVTDERFLKAAEELICITSNKRLDTDRVRLRMAHEGVVFEDENIKVEYIQNKHITFSPSYSILISEGSKRVLFSGDLSSHLRENDIPNVIFEEDVDTYVSELAHFSLDELAPYLDRMRTKKLLFTHVYPENKYKEIEKIKGKYHFEVITPQDGFEIVV